MSKGAAFLYSTFQWNGGDIAQWQFIFYCNTDPHKVWTQSLLFQYFVGQVMLILRSCLSMCIQYYVSRCEHHRDHDCIYFLELCKGKWKLLCFSDIENGSHRDHLLFCVFKIEDLWPKKLLREANAYFAGDFYVLWGKSATYSGLFETDRHKPGVSNLGPAGKIWPASPFHRAREEILSVNKNFVFTKNLLIL